MSHSLFLDLLNERHGPAYEEEEVVNMDKWMRCENSINAPCSSSSDRGCSEEGSETIRRDFAGRRRKGVTGGNEGGRVEDERKDIANKE